MIISLISAHFEGVKYCKDSNTLNFIVLPVLGGKIELFLRKVNNEKSEIQIHRFSKS